MRSITVQNLVKEILETIPQPYEADIIDRVFQAIENNPEWMEIFQNMVQAHGHFPVEKSIEYNTISLTGMKSLAQSQKAHSKLIENYPELGNQS